MEVVRDEEVAKGEEYVTAEQLESLRTNRSTYFGLKDKLADITIAEERLKLDKQTALSNYSIALTDLQNIEREITEQYGNVKVNLETGQLS